MKQIKAKGFTLIELVITLIILAIVGVIALPKFISFTEESHVAKLQEVKANMQQSVDFAHQRWLLNGHPGGMNDLEGFAHDAEGNPQLDMSAQGYPLGVNKNNPMGAPLNIGRGEQACGELWNALLDTELTVSHKLAHKDQVDFISRRVSTSHSTGLNACVYAYTHLGFEQDLESSALMLTYNIVTGKVELTNRL
ncbi:prepilin-type N-terminal cleavage/methylation domain-containing protein [Shewanella submarina]|uniref:Type IV pilin protein n=1 Tax=Shewanella submarina TaxID=2016376 RepID=A0ABV7GJ75_9GAMM|nr:prepilin-type N-terminal cleavage/methylation domain-containing protein [Shewanella submarina]MCL1038161.1 prepilin-type N-terminal cleavage/methylation domain-containing protein [Shewanella submarina]